jgi:glycosyltransferase involved in cell wall biosynthesis
MARPRLLLDLTPLRTPGGARGIGRYIRELALGLSELPPGELGGLDIVALTSLGWTGSHTFTRDLSTVVDVRPDHIPTGRDYYVWAYRQRIAFWNAALRLGATAVHICDAHATPRLLKLARIKKIVTCHDLIPTRFPEHYMGPGDGGPVVGKLIERARYTSADLVVAVSDATGRDVRELLGVPSSRVVRVYNGIDLDRWITPPARDAAETLARLGLQARPFALYVGGSDWRKNVDGMLAAIVRARSLGVELDLAWVGHLEPKHAARVEETARAVGIGTNLRMLGFVDDGDLAVLYRAAVAHLFVSRLEGFGLTIVEAMASGCPVVTTRAGSLGEVAGDAALTVDPEDRNAIAQALIRLVREPALREDLVKRGKERAPRFSRTAQARATAAVYRKFFALG